LGSLKVNSDLKESEASKVFGDKIIWRIQHPQIIRGHFYHNLTHTPLKYFWANAFISHFKQHKQSMQGDQIRRNLAYWVVVNIGQFLN
jgi:hypothetical protein